jgi:precorrin-8X/cobalt-precorrin-8 methylmutase
MEYLRDPSAIYARSFAIIAAEARFGAMPGDAKKLATRVIHACGMVEIAEEIVISDNFVTAATSALRSGGTILADSEMVRHGISHDTWRNAAICTLNDPRTKELAIANQTTRSAAAVELWRPQLLGALAVVGNAPTALFALLEKLDAGWPKPAAIIALPVGFVGAAEAKEELIGKPLGVPFITLPGRRGGSAMAAAAINALVEEVET